MPKLVECDELAALILIPAGGDFFSGRRALGLLLMLDHGTRGAVLHGVGQLAEAMKSVFKQFGHQELCGVSLGAAPADDFEIGLIDNPAAAGANIEAVPAASDARFHFIAVGVAWIKAIAARCIAAKAAPSFAVCCVVGDAFHRS